MSEGVPPRPIRRRRLENIMKAKVVENEPVDRGRERLHVVEAVSPRAPGRGGYGA